jgi:hypothetical protein
VRLSGLVPRVTDVSIPTLTASLKIEMGWNAQLPVTGLQPRADQETQAPKQAYVQGAGAGAVNEVYWNVLTVGAGASTTLDLSAGLADVLGQTFGFARVKAFMVWLLSTATTDTLVDGTVGTACSGVTIGNAATNPWAGTGYPVSDQATGTITLANGEKRGWARGDATGWVVDGTHKSLKVLNNDGAVAAKLVIAALGADT